MFPLTSKLARWITIPIMRWVKVWIWRTPPPSIIIFATPILLWGSKFIFMAHKVSFQFIWKSSLLLPGGLTCVGWGLGDRVFFGVEITIELMIPFLRTRKIFLPRGRSWSIKRVVRRKLTLFKVLFMRFKNAKFSVADSRHLSI